MYCKNGVSDEGQVLLVMPICFNILLSFLLFSVLSTETSITFHCRFLYFSLNWSMSFNSVAQTWLKSVQLGIELDANGEVL